MTTESLISTVLLRIASDFYGPDRVHEFCRDRRALMGAIGRYGYECLKRGWFLNADFIYGEISRLLSQIKAHKADIRYLPVYLESAVDKAVRQHAEELSHKAKLIAPNCARIVAGTHSVEAVREKTDVEVLDALYRNIRPKKGRKIGKQKVLKL